MNIMFASHTYMGGPFVVGSHHLARELEKLGHSVIHISTPITPFHLLKLNNPEYRERFRILTGQRKSESPGLVNSVPLSLFTWKMAGPIFKRTGKNWMLPSVRRLLKSNGMDSVDLLFIDQPSFVGLDKLVKPKLTIYRPTDLYSQMTGNATIEAAEEMILATANGLVSTSDPVLSALKPYNPELPALLLENGVEFDHFAEPAPEPPEWSEIPGPRAVYVGAIDQRLDLEAMKRMATELPDVSIVVIGPYGREISEFFAACSNVYLLGAKDYKLVPSYLQHADVALLPLSNHAANKGRSPMKLYEYAAAGLPVVVTETPELLRRQEQFLYFCKEPEDYADKVREALHAGQDKRHVQQLARRHAWNSKVEELLAFVNAIQATDAERNETVCH